MDPQFVSTALAVHLPSILRYAGAIAKRLRPYNIGLTGKTTGSTLTDALTLADLTLQELLVAALRDTDPIFQHCRLEAEEATGDLARFACTGELTIALDPIDGTQQYRDQTGNGYAVMLHLRSRTEVLYSLVFLPEGGTSGRWLEVTPDRAVYGFDDTTRPAADVLRSFPAIERLPPADGQQKIYLIGFQQRDELAAQQVTAAGLVGVTPAQMPDSIYPLLAKGEFAGSLIHSPNVYDFPVSLQLARLYGGDAVWVNNRQPVHFKDVWLDERADMVRLPGIVACSSDPAVLSVLCDLAASWNPDRYHPGAGLE